MQAHVVVKAVIVNHSLRKVLLIRRSPDDFGGWEGPGGAVEEGETLEEAVIREILEETGLIVGLERLLYVSLDEICEKIAIFIVYLCHTTEEKVMLSGEHIDYCWVDKEECKTMLEGGIAKDFMKYGVYELEW